MANKVNTRLNPITPVTLPTKDTHRKVNILLSQVTVALHHQPNTVNSLLTANNLNNPLMGNHHTVELNNLPIQTNLNMADNSLLTANNLSNPLMGNLHTPMIALASLAKLQALAFKAQDKRVNVV